MKTTMTMLALLALTACSNNDIPTPFLGEDYNSEALYGDTGLPKNCRAIVQANINMYKEAINSNISDEQKMYETEGVFESLERNCGRNGKSWEPY